MPADVNCCCLHDSLFILKKYLVHISFVLVTAIAGSGIQW